MTPILSGIRVLEIAQYIFVPSAGALLAEWGADVVKVEHPVRGDAQRGFVRMMGAKVDPDCDPTFQHANRGKRSIGIDIGVEEGRALVYRLAAESDVLLTNLLPDARQKLKIDVEHIRAVNPDIVYARGSAYGDKGPERERGGFDGTAFWVHSGIAHALTPESYDVPLSPAIGGFGDSIGAMNLAGGIVGALFHRDRTGEALDVDVSLVSSAWWAAGVAVNQAMMSGEAPRAREPMQGASPFNPFVGNFLTSDGGVIFLYMLQPGPFIADTFAHLGIAEAAADPRFAEGAALMQNGAAAGALVEKAFAEKPLSYWREHLKSMRGQWAAFQSVADLAKDAQARANDMTVTVQSASGKPVELVRGPVQYGGEPAQGARAPQAGEHGEAILLEMGLDWDEIARLKDKGALS